MSNQGLFFCPLRIRRFYFLETCTNGLQRITVVPFQQKTILEIFFQEILSIF
ncbi:hypothetical protein LEP1GSC195_1946 [Leptospira wolbachii serovar Codice str. CDC]|uniref:Uncharacterized protein n=1 Tax=Leptospira wolbachii serovar Codice str. CDC TaxID=1218599 RepID=R9A6T6_9LEPT|nr:hypothetical protein LEP1GSC195_1946 [Leptospira wolbachii serovar Codice str. CDC]